MPSAPREQTSGEDWWPCVRVGSHWVWVVLTLAACGERSSRAAGHPENTDDFGNPIPVGLSPHRIVSLDPAATQFLFTMGAGGRVVGRTHWDLYPPAATAAKDLGDGLQPNLEAVLAMHPDLVILYASPSDRVVADRLRAAGVSTVALRTDLVADFHRMARVLSEVVGDSAAARSITDSVDRTMARVRAATAALGRPRVLWVLWEAPLFAAGHGSFFDELITAAGGRNLYGDIGAPSPAVTLEDVLRRDPQVIFAGAHVAQHIRADPRWQRTTAVRTGRVLEPDTTIAGQPSVRMGEASAYLAELLHPGVLDDSSARHDAGARHGARP